MNRGAGERLRRALRWPAATSFHGLQWLRMQAQATAALGRSGRRLIRATYPGRQPLRDGGKVAVFAHFDRDGRVHDFVLTYLRALGQAGFAVVFVSNAPRLANAAVEQLRPLVALVLHRRNLGYDFAAYQDGLAALGELARFDQVVLANDSVYGPLFDLGALLRRCDDRADVWGMTDNREHRYHLQSYFLLFRRTVLTNPAFAAFWRAVRPVQSRQWVIRRYEVGLTQHLQRAGLRCGALFPCETVAAGAAAANSDKPVNVMHVHWDRLISVLGCPFIKRELLLYNPLKVAHVSRWRDVIRRASFYDTELIARHLCAQRRHAP
jgi:lipopolysaccharide biosynthesis protein